MALFSRRLGVEHLDARRMFAALVSGSLTVPQPTWQPQATLEMNTPFLSPVATDSSLVEEEVLDQIAVSVAAENLSGVRAAEFRFEYKADTLDIDPASMKLGDAWRGKASMIKRVDEQAGSISVFIFSAQPLGEPEGEMFEFHASLAANSTVDTPTNLMELVKFELNEGQMTSVPTVNLQVSGRSGDMVASPTATPTTLPLLFKDAFANQGVARSAKTVELDTEESVDVIHSSESAPLQREIVRRVGLSPVIYVSDRLSTLDASIISVGASEQRVMHPQMPQKRLTIVEPPVSVVATKPLLPSASSVQHSDEIAVDLDTEIRACPAWW